MKRENLERVEESAAPKPLFVNFQLNFNEAMRRHEYWAEMNRPDKLKLLNELIDRNWDAMYFEEISDAKS